MKRTKLVQLALTVNWHCSNAKMTENNTSSSVQLVGDNTSFPWHVHTFCIVGTIVCLIGVISNSLVIGSTCRKGSELRGKTNFLLFALAIADLGSNLASIQVFVYFWIGWTHWNRLECFYGVITQIITIGCEAYIVFTVALDRVIMLKYPVW